MVKNRILMILTASFALILLQPAMAMESGGNISNGLISKSSFIVEIDEVNNVKVIGALPQIEGLNKSSLTMLNEKIRLSYTGLINAGYRSIETEYDVYNWANITSIVIRYNIGGEKSLNKKQVVQTFVFDDISQSEVTLKNLLGKDYMTYINRYISSRIDKNAAAYYAGSNRFSSIRPNQSFFIKDGVIHILFDEYTIAPASAGIAEFEIPVDSLAFTLSRGEYAVENGITYIPVTAAMRLGMKVGIKTGGIMEITSYDNNKITEININNDKINRANVMLINGYNIALSADYFSMELGIGVQKKEFSTELEISYIF